MIKAVIFDMDGLMINSEVATFHCYEKVMEKLGYTITEEFYKTLLGKTLKTCYQLFFEAYGNDFPMDQVLADVHQELADIFDNEGVPIKDGLIELLIYLKENQYKTIVATSSGRKRVDHILELADLTKYFDNSICGDEVTHGKPNPEVFLRACEKLDVQPNEAIVLEDSEAGIQAAYSGHIPVICIPDMKYPEKQYEDMTAAMLSSLDQVIEYLRKN
jgi:HAD superfamily hydrolase (TIGR01509 family)